MSDEETNISSEIQVTKRNLHTGMFLITIIGMFLTYWAVKNISDNYLAAKAIENDYSSFTENGEILWKKNSETKQNSQPQ